MFLWKRKPWIRGRFLIGSKFIAMCLYCVKGQLMGYVVVRLVRHETLTTH